MPPITATAYLQAQAPIFVKKSIWESCSTPLRNSSTWATVTYIEQQRDSHRRGGGGGVAERRASRCVDVLYGCCGHRHACFVCPLTRSTWPKLVLAV